MENIKMMLLGLATMILPSSMHLFTVVGVIADLVVIVGLCFVAAGFWQKGE